jgi:hypothetical protein
VADLRSHQSTYFLVKSIVAAVLRGQAREMLWKAAALRAEVVMVVPLLTVSPTHVTLLCLARVLHLSLLLCIVTAYSSSSRFK